MIPERTRRFHKPLCVHYIRHLCAGGPPKSRCANTPVRVIDLETRALEAEGKGDSNSSRPNYFEHNHE